MKLGHTLFTAIVASSIVFSTSASATDVFDVESVKRPAKAAGSSVLEQGYKIAMDVRRMQATERFLLPGDVQGAENIYIEYNPGDDSGFIP